ncbi:hypothetical protein ARSEF1564_008943 [Beauveria bassiana]
MLMTYRYTQPSPSCSSQNQESTSVPVTHGHFDGDRIAISDMRNTALLQCNPRSSAHLGI